MALLHVDFFSDVLGMCTVSGRDSAAADKRTDRNGGKRCGG